MRHAEPPAPCPRAFSRAGALVPESKTKGQARLRSDDLDAKGRGPGDPRFDLIIAEHVFEHLRWPYPAAKNVLQMLAPSGHFLIVTPFLYKVHPDPLDCVRWTEQGLRYFLEDAGFPEGQTTSGSWGNRRCIEATFRRDYRLFNRFLHPVDTEPDYPIVVWALARSGNGGSVSFRTETILQLEPGASYGPTTIRRSPGRSDRAHTGSCG